MHITDVTMTMVRRPIVPRQYSRRLKVGGEQELGVLTIHTGEGGESHVLPILALPLRQG